VLRWVLIAVFVVSSVTGCSSPVEKTKEGGDPIVILNNGGNNANNGSSNNGDPVITECGPGRDLCDGACVDVSVDPQRCGSCSAAPCGDTQVCSDGACVEVPTDCRVEGECPNRYFCDENTGLCQVGCKSNADCPASAYCELASHACLCTDASNVVCGGECTAEGPLSCGTTCETCPAVANGSAVCTDGQCDLGCADGYMLCDGKCAACPGGDAVLGLACLGDQCVASECAAGHETSDGACAACPATTGSESLGCDGNQCIITDCPPDTKLCGGACAACPPSDPSGNVQCSGTECVLVCQGGFHSCGDFCAADDDPYNCGANCQYCDSDGNGFAVCEASRCGLECDTGYEACGGACAACPSGPGIQTTGCAGASCVVQACSAGYTPCSFGCCQAAPDGIVKDWGNWITDVSIALDSRGYPHIAYTNSTLSQVRYAYWAGNQWKDEYVGGGWDVAIALDSQDRAHVGIWNRDGGSADYGFRDATGTWTIEKVEQFSVGMTPDIALAGATIHMVFYDQTREDLRYATRTGTSGTWTKSTVESSGKAGYSPNIFLNGSLVWLAYHDGTNQGLRFAEQSGSTWAIETVDDSGSFDFGINPSLAMDGGGIPHVAYEGNVFASAADGVYYGNRVLGTWSAMRLFEDADNPVLFVDTVGNAEIVYQNRVDGDILYSSASSGWSSVPVYTTDYVGEELDAVKASNGDIHIAFGDGTNKTLRYLVY